MIFKLFIWLLILAIFHALWEIQIEDKEGWAKKLPTFRINVFMTKLLIGKEITGYHLYMLALFITIFHGVFLFLKWSWKIEFLVLGLYNIYFVIEDFLWFVFNTKHYGIKKFRPGKIEWHKRWFLGLPTSYWIGIIFSIISFIIAFSC